MLRDKTLIPLSHQHQHALALCVRIERASPIAQEDMVAWQAEIVQLVREEIEIHFAAEENVIFPAARARGELTALVGELVAEHAALRKWFGMAQDGVMSATELLAFSHGLAAHIRKEERLLFERMQELMSREELDGIGQKLEQELNAADQACIVPNAVTRLQPDKKHS